MKYKKEIANLKAAQVWWDRLSEREKASLTHPGGINQTTGAAS